MTDQREQALAAAFERITNLVYAHHADAPVQRDLALVRAALTPAPPPADLAEIQALISYLEREGESYLSYAKPLRALIAELAELRARPTLTAEEWKTIRMGLSTFHLPELKAKLRAIAEGAGSINSTTNHEGATS